VVDQGQARPGFLHVHLHRRRRLYRRSCQYVDQAGVYPDSKHAGSAGLSMGGAETLRVGPSRLDLFAYMGVFSMGLQEGHDAGVHPDFEERNVGFFGDPDRTNQMVRLFYVAAGEDDQIIGDGARRLSETLTRRGIRHEFHETEGGHTWINWRRYFYDFAQKLFR
jgi:enterochelin esterase-like enzyme